MQVNGCMLVFLSFIMVIKSIFKSKMFSSRFDIMPVQFSDIIFCKSMAKVSSCDPASNSPSHWHFLLQADNTKPLPPK